MTLAELEDFNQYLAALEVRLQRTERSLRLQRVAWTVLVVLLVSFGIGLTVANAQAPQPQKLRLRELDIVDEKGRERIVIAAPIPAPLVNGMPGHRVREIAAAVQFKALDGNEQGGIAMSDDGSMIVGIDDERGQERAHLYYLPKRGSGVYLQGQNGKGTISLLLPNGGSDAGLTMTDSSGKAVLDLPAKK